MKAIRFVLVVWVLLWICQRAASDVVALAWDRNPEPDVVGYNVWRINGPAPHTLLVTATTPSATVSALDGWVIGVTAFNATLQSAMSATVTITMAAIRPGITLVHETGSDALGWTEVGRSYDRLTGAAPAQFYRCRITSGSLFLQRSINLKDWEEYERVSFPPDSVTGGWRTRLIVP